MLLFVFALLIVPEREFRLDGVRTER